MSRRNWCSRPGPARRWPRSRRCWPRATRSWPSSRWITAPLFGGARGRGTHRRRARGEPLRPAAHQGGRRARSFPRLHGRVRARRDLQVRRPRGEERHRLRSLQAAGRLLGHARGDDRRDGQGAAAGRDRGRPFWCSASTMRRAAQGDGGGDGLALRCLRRRRICRPRSRPALPKPHRRSAAVTALRLEGVAPSVAHRKSVLESARGAFRRARPARCSGFAGVLAGGARRRAIRGEARPHSTATGSASPPRRNVRLAHLDGADARRRGRARARERAGAEVMYDWAGGLVWAAVPSPTTRTLRSFAPAWPQPAATRRSFALPRRCAPRSTCSSRSRPCLRH